ncbi:MAG: hypothetical protein II003_03415 [Methanobrevibacter sp.]|nr:hypothetical protein [Methanobrevibacter sp.]
MTVCEEMQQLRQMLDAKKIKWIDKSEDYSKPEFKMWICRTHFDYDGHHYSVINGFGTYGGWHGFNAGVNESDNMGLLELAEGYDVIKGWMTAEQVIKAIVG